MYKKVIIPYRKFSGMINIAFLKGLFIKPEQNEFLLKDLNSSTDLSKYIMYFEENYYLRLISKLDFLIQNGDFERSNSFEDWVELCSYLKVYENINLEIEKTKVKIVNHPLQNSFI